MHLGCQDRLVPGATLADRIAFLEGNGFSGIELRETDVFDRKMARTLSRANLPVCSLCVEVGGLLSADRAQRDQSVRHIRNLLQAGADLGADGIICVPRMGAPTVPDLSPAHSSYQLERALLIQVLGALCETAEQIGIDIWLEPLNRYLQPHLVCVRDAVEVVEAIGSPRLGILVDYCHATLEEMSFEAALRAAGPFLRHVHLAELNRGLPGQGDTDFSRLLTQLSKEAYTRWVVLEGRWRTADPAREFRLCRDVLQAAGL